jgi:hypothetical protein
MLHAQKGGIFKCCSTHTFAPAFGCQQIISSVDSQTASQPWAVYLSDNAAPVPTPLYDMSSLDSSIDRPKKDIVEMRR